MVRFSVRCGILRTRQFRLSSLFRTGDDLVQLFLRLYDSLLLLDLLLPALSVLDLF